ncbi:EAL domain-containing protein [Vibrio rotiferianus]|uniref:EAL domain-containing protein n=1 Tax=Vibrio rotiferianus TaxID=190895 RepID=UPI0011103A6D|nr:EAL domain-containing protein [Vibrio rotiferianus]TMX31389.1 EAL domain-containing protein [Vibrio rotiferianus]TMX43010.1 EAL domain-containing protein [Vibrio rotiferianus]TMX60074.1 EAL domain-containing protein [Vibrio rotiferianus]
MELTKQSDYERYIRIDENGEHCVHLHQFVFRSVYQPIFDHSRTLIGMEALLRIETIDGVSIRPDIFFSDNSWDKSFRLAVEFLSRAIHIRNFAKHFAGSGVKLFLNVMPAALLTLTTDMGFKDTGLLYQRLKALNMETSDVVFEVIEQHCEETESLIKAVEKLKASGFLFAIDDYGAQYSDQKRVLQLCPDIIKIDRSYLLEFCNGNEDAVFSAMELAQNLGAKVVIEGVEQENQLAAMQALCVDFYQGFYLGKPKSIHHWTAQKANAKVLH